LEGLVLEVWREQGELGVIGLVGEVGLVLSGLEEE